MTVLVFAAEDELLVRYPDQATSPLDPHARFVVAYVMGEPVGCGALAPVSPGVSEIKRMYVLPAHRHAGVESLVLETGVNQPEVVTLYESLGYERTEPYGEYVDNPTSLCYAKKIAR